MRWRLEVRNYESVHIGSAPETDGRGTEPSEILPGAIRTVTGRELCWYSIELEIDNAGVELSRLNELNE